MVVVLSVCVCIRGMGGYSIFARGTKEVIVGLWEAL